MKKLRRIINQRIRAHRRALKARARRLSPARVLLIEEMAVVGAALSFWLMASGTVTGAGVGYDAGMARTITAFCLGGLLLATVIRRVAHVIDRRSTRGAYDERRIITDLGQAARAVTTIEQLFKLIVDKIQDALHTENISIFVRDDESGDYVCEISAPHLTLVEQCSTEPLVLSRYAFVVTRLKNLGIPLGIDPEDFKMWTQALASDAPRTRDARKREIETLQRINARLLLQVMMRDQLIGIISIGPKVPDQPFSPEDKRMLMSVAGQTAFIIENAKLVQRMVEEERLRRELSVAAEVQRRLFPTHPPAVATLELSGFCQPARGVGGDYYDFLKLGDGQIGIAVADVAGKGISAALLMSTVQASLRSQAMAARGSLADLVSTMNQLMYSSTGSSSYATFFYAQFDEQTRCLTYVNAGHNPPFLLRSGSAKASEMEYCSPWSGRRGGEYANGISSAGTAAALLEAPAATALAAGSTAAEATSLLTCGGPVIGIFSDCLYEQETIQLQSGDLLFAYTDGVTEAFNAEGQEFGEHRLQQVLAEATHLPADEVRERVVRCVREWCGNAPQHDDLTFVVLKVK